MRRRTVVIVGSVVLVAALIGIAVVVIPRLGTRLASPPPWRAGEVLQPLSTDDPRLASVARARQIEDWIRTRMTAATTPDRAQWDRILSFDENRLRGDDPRPRPAGLVAGQEVGGEWEQSPSTPAADERAQLGVRWFAAPTDRDRYLTDVAQRSGTEVVPAPGVPGGSGARVTVSAGSCVQGGNGRLDSVYGVVGVGQVLAVSVSFSCVAPTDQTAFVTRVQQALGIAAAEVRGLAELPLPGQVFDLSDSYPVISSGSWSDEQIVVDPGAGDRAEQVLPVELQNRQVEAVLDGQHTVVITRSPDAAARILDDEVAVSRPMPTREEPVDYADRQVCRPGEHWQEGTTCWTRVGRFVIISVHGRNQREREVSTDVSDQATLLR